MTTAKKFVLVTLAVMAALSLPVVRQWHTAKELRKENEQLRTEKRQLESAHHALVERLQDNDALVAQLQRETAELPALRGEVVALRQIPGGSANRPSADIGNDRVDESFPRRNPMDRMNRGRELRKQGSYAEALKEYLWCFDEGSRDPAFAGVRVSFLLSEMADLARQFPPAREALLSRRDAAEAAVLSGGASGSTVFELAALNTKLGEQEKNLSLFDQLPPDSPVRGNLVKAASQQFLAARRYQDIVELNDPETAFLRALSLFLMSDKPAVSMARDAQTKMILNAGGDGVEVLAGVGQTERAKALAEKVLQVSASDETLAQLIRQAERAGNGEVAGYLKGKYAPNEPP